METQAGFIKQLVAKAEEDTEFRGRLLTDPNAALTEVFGITVPEDFKVIVHEEDARTAHLVLPAAAELSDAQLQ